MVEGGLPISMISSIPSELLLSDALLITEVTFADMVAIEAWEVMAMGAGIAVMAVGVTSTVVRDKGAYVCFLLGDGGII